MYLKMIALPYVCWRATLFLGSYQKREGCLTTAVWGRPSPLARSRRRALGHHRRGQACPIDMVMRVADDTNFGSGAIGADGHAGSGHRRCTKGPGRGRVPGP